MKDVPNNANDSHDASTPRPPPRRHRFRPNERLRKQSDFERVFAGRSRVGDDLLVVYVAPNDLAWSRLGIRVGKRVGGAVTRNRIKRRIREAFRLSKHEVPKGFDLICVAQIGVVTKDNPDFAASLINLTRRAVNRLRRSESKRDRQSPDRDSDA